jgi:hypothetical protein
MRRAGSTAGACPRKRILGRCEPVVLQFFLKGKSLEDGQENRYCPSVDIEDQVLLMVVDERLIFVLG